MTSCYNSMWLFPIGPWSSERQRLWVHKVLDAAQTASCEEVTHHCQAPCWCHTSRMNDSERVHSQPVPWLWKWPFLQMSSQHLIITGIWLCNQACPSVTYKLIYTQWNWILVYLSDISVQHLVTYYCVRAWWNRHVIWSITCIWSCDVLKMMGERKGGRSRKIWERWGGGERERE